jgi:xanthine/uracil/vitamin C permease (AzgA family)
VAAQADLLDEEGRIENGNKALSSDSVSSIFAGVVGGTPAAVFIVLTGNIVTGIMLGFATLVIGRVVAGEFKKLNVGIVVTCVVLVGFYLGGWDV